MSAVMQDTNSPVTIIEEGSSHTTPPTEDSSTSWKWFLKTTQKHFFELVSGGAIQGIITIVLGITLWQLPPFLFVMVLSIYIVLASFRSWRDEQNTKNTLIQTLKEKEKTLLDKEQILSDRDKMILSLNQQLTAEITKNTPEMLGQLKGRWIGLADDGGTGITYVISVSNTGMASVAVDWHLRLSVPGLQTIIVNPTHYPGTLSLTADQVLGNEFKGEEAIYNKTITPIQTGAIIQGYILFKIPLPREMIDRRGTVAKIIFWDVKRKEYSVIDDRFPSGSSEPPVYYPGLPTKPLPPESRKPNQNKSRPKRRK